MRSDIVVLCWPWFDFVFQSLTAPSPTVCTKEAMNIVMGMFNSSLDIDKDLGWEEGGQGNVSLPPQNGQQHFVLW